MVGAGEIDGLDYIGDPSAAGDERGLAVDHAIPDGAGLIVARVARTEQWATHAGLEPLHSGLVQDPVGASDGDNAQVFHGSLLWFGPDVADSKQVHASLYPVLLLHSSLTKASSALTLWSMTDGGREVVKVP